MTPRAVGIFGLGLMGGSLARDLAERGIDVWGHDRQAGVVEAAMAAGIVRGRLDPDNLQPLDLYVLATPVDAAIDLLRSLADRLPDRSLVTDLGSTKAKIVREAEALGLGGRFVGSHPLTGDHRSGWEAARSSLYRGATVFLCTAGEVGAGNVEALAALWRSLGACPVTIEAEEHDRRMAWVSHLPQVVASALATAVERAGYQPDDLGPGGRDMTRLAASSPEMWAAIAETNAAELQQALLELEAALASLRGSLAARDTPALLRFFRAANRWIV